MTEDHDDRPRGDDTREDREPAAEGPWYSGGLGFSCTECGRCCSGPHGYVWLTDADLLELARALELELDELGRRYVRRVGRRYALVDGRGGDCVFLCEGRCSVYDARPRQCRSYPWWKENLASPEAWAAEAEQCEGIREDAPVVPAAAIRRALKG